MGRFLGERGAWGWGREKGVHPKKLPSLSGRGAGGEGGLQSRAAKGNLISSFSLSLPLLLFHHHRRHQFLGRDIRGKGCNRVLGQNSIILGYTLQEGRSLAGLEFEPGQHAIDRRPASEEIARYCRPRSVGFNDRRRLVDDRLLTPGYRRFQPLSRQEPPRNVAEAVGLRKESTPAAGVRSWSQGRRDARVRTGPRPSPHRHRLARPRRLDGPREVSTSPWVTEGSRWKSPGRGLPTAGFARPGIDVGPRFGGHANRPQRPSPG